MAKVKGVIVANSSDCGRPTDKFFEVTSNVDIPVAFVTTRVTKGIRMMQRQAADLKHSQKEALGGSVRHDDFIYVSILHSGRRSDSAFIARMLASTHILLASMVLFTLVIYLLLACTVGSLRHIPREIVPEIFGPRPEPVDGAVIEQLPLLYVNWDVCPPKCSMVPEKNSDNDENDDDHDDEESRYETPESGLEPFKIENEILQQQLAQIIQCVGNCSYSFTEERGCAICLGKYAQKDLLRLLPCKHAFHQRCIDTWLLSKDMTVHCPVCKSNINTGLEQLKRHGYNRILDLIRGNPHDDIAADTISDSLEKDSNQLMESAAEPSSSPSPAADSMLASPFLYFYDVVCEPMVGLFSHNVNSRRPD
ncbi:hypothetical protein IW140_005494 [Coemansia sp. RSA 1813]|nr:hypothetical protein LPJ74_004810 [Coemansia sp. RSA 1843]KAJ2565024.1 hypothetical protein IW140_005494 [Coemansia sp. RSA 1813]